MLMTGASVQTPLSDPHQLPHKSIQNKNLKEILYTDRKKKGNDEERCQGRIEFRIDKMTYKIIQYQKCGKKILLQFSS